MRGDIRCIDGRLWRHDPQDDDPELETDVGKCEDCGGKGCTPDAELREKLARIIHDSWCADPFNPDMHSEDYVAADAVMKAFPQLVQ